MSAGTKPTLVLLTVCALLSEGQSFAASSKPSDGEIHLEQRIRGNDVVVDIETTGIGSSAFSDGVWWGADEVTRPKEIIKYIRVSSGAEKAHVPLSAYADLGDPRLASLSATGRGFSIKIKGGDAAGAYEVTLEFEDNTIVRRHVASGEFPDQAWEETVYTFNNSAE
jgi:hypothetical protein